ncbi:unnamed protein product, partial [Heterotrigona itama]
RHGNLEDPATTLPTCCPHYPPGSTLLECRFEGDQPVAHVVQIPDERSTTTQKTCLLVETKASKFGPSARIVSYPQDDSTKSDQPCSDSSSKHPMTYCLESRECSEGPIARAVLVSTENSSDTVTTLHIKKGDEQPEQPCSKIMYGPTIDKTEEAVRSAKKDREDPKVSFFGCAASKKQATARITRCSRNDKNVGAKKCFETRAPRNSDCPTAVGFVCPPERSRPCQHSVVEAKIDEHGPETRMISFAEDDDYYGYTESKACEGGPSAKITHQPVIDPVTRRDLDYFQARSGLDQVTCPSREKDSKEKPAEKREQKRGELPPPPPPPVKRRNGLDESSRTSKSPGEGTRGRVCPAYCCQPVPKPKSCSAANVDPKCRSASPPCESKPAEKPKSCDDVEKRKLTDKTKLAETCRRRVDDVDAKDCTRSSEDVPRITSEELLTRYREYMPANTLNRYEACRSKRNGLQDQCRLPVPRIVLELKRKETQCRE